MTRSMQEIAASAVTFLRRSFDAFGPGCKKAKKNREKSGRFIEKTIARSTMA
jgi:hypothetical protein